MSREIEFRARNLEGKLVYGVTNLNAVGIIKNSLEQYTGLKDKNGKKIFEGDIIQFQSIKVWYQNEIMLKKMQCKTQKEFDDWYKTLKLPKGIVIETVFDAYDIGQNELTNFYQIIGNIHEEAQDE